MLSTVFLCGVPSRKCCRAHESPSFPCVYQNLDWLTAGVHLCGSEGAFALLVNAVLVSCPAAILMWSRENLPESKMWGLSRELCWAHVVGSQMPRQEFELYSIEQRQAKLSVKGYGVIILNIVSHICSLLHFFSFYLCFTILEEPRIV